MKLIKLKAASYNYANYSCGHIYAIWGCEFDGVIRYVISAGRRYSWELRHYDPDRRNFRGELVAAYRYHSKAKAIEAAESIGAIS